MEYLKNKNFSRSFFLYLFIFKPGIEFYYYEIPIN